MRAGMRLITLLVSSMTMAQLTAEKIVIAQRGAIGSLPEHTLAAKSMAYAIGANHIEQDVVMTNDDVLIVLHDITLDRTADVAEKFSNRPRGDGRFYAIDFTLKSVIVCLRRFSHSRRRKISRLRESFPHECIII